ncbi:MAG: response regulator [Myxococcales bacterium]|nr:response regulator [Myxococcales bacterium]
MIILVVDDDPVNLQLMVHALAGSYEVHTTQDGHEALRLVRQLSPDLVLLDIMMPDLDGLQVCRLLRADPATADTPVMFVTAVDSTEGERVGLELGAVDYITKPLDLRLTKLRIKNQLELRRQHNLIAEQNAQLTDQNHQLQQALDRVKHLEGILSLCMYCKKVRTENDAWQQLESYVTQHSDARFSHGMCPECFAVQDKLTE